ncbi:MAG: dipeptide epimerase [Phycisphaerae bacterium]
MALKLAVPFRTATAYRTQKETIRVRLEHDGTVGCGEAVPADTYGQSLESAESALRRMSESLSLCRLDIEALVFGLLAVFDDQRATVAAVDAALHDWTGRKLGISTLRWLGLDPAGAPLTSFTIGMDEPDALADNVRAAGAYPILKIKVGSDCDEENLSIIRRLAPDKIVRVDANTAWTAEAALVRLPMLASFGVELLEQPVPREDIDGLRRLKEAAVLPIIADESCVRPSDIEVLAGCVDGINIKLSKCGGIHEALRMIRLARRFGMRVMLGCMIESSLGVAAAAQLAPLADWIDLDGHLLLEDDPYTGLGGAAGRLRLGASPGLGVEPRGGQGAAQE